MNSQETLSKEGSPLDPITSQLFGIYYLGNLAHTWFVKKPWAEAGAILNSGEAAAFRNIQGNLAEMAQIGQAGLKYPELKERVDALEGLGEALVLKSRASFFANVESWNPESVEMFLRWSDDWLEETLRGWGRQREAPPSEKGIGGDRADTGWGRLREAPPTQVSRVAAVIRNDEDTAKQLFDFARIYRICYRQMRALVTDYCDCRRIEDDATLSAEKQGEFRERQELIKSQLQSCQEGLLLCVNGLNNDWQEARRLIAMEALSDYDKAVKDKFSKLGVGKHLSEGKREHLIEEIDAESRRLYSVLHAKWERTVFVPWANPLKRLSVTWKYSISDADVVSGVPGPHSWKRMVEPDQLRAFGDGIGTSFMPTEFMTGCFEKSYAELLSQTVPDRCRALEKEIVNLAKATRLEIDRRELLQFNDLIKGLTSLADGWDAAKEVDVNARNLVLSIRRVLGAARSASKARAEHRAKQEAPTSEARAKQEAPKGMVRIPGGKFRSHWGGGRVRTVSVDDFYIDTHPVTCKQFKKFLDENPEWQRHNEPDGADGGYLGTWVFAFGVDDPSVDQKNVYFPGEADNPVEWVSWHAAMAYAAWAGKRLPTEAEWEYAARGGLEDQAYPCGDTITCADISFVDDLFQTRPVEAYPPNGYGLYDVVGNVWEWCLDEYVGDDYAVANNSRNPIAGSRSIQWLCENFTSLITDPISSIIDAPMRALRGHLVSPDDILRLGSEDDPAGGLARTLERSAVAHRIGMPAPMVLPRFGFRCVKDVAR